MSQWYESMAEANLLFHPDEAAEEIVLISDGSPSFSKEECVQINEIMLTMFKRHGVRVYEAAYPFFMKAIHGHEEIG